MPLLQRVGTLIRANLNDLIDKAEEPEKMLKQLLLDLQNQHMQVKTQVAIAIADQHLLEKKRAENAQLQQDYVHRAQLAVQKKDESLARTALSRSVSYEAAAKNFSQQIEDQMEEVRLLRDALHQLELKIAEGRTRCDILVTRQQRSRARSRATQVNLQGDSHDRLLERIKTKVDASEALGIGRLLAAAPDSSARLEAIEREDQVDRLLADLKAKAI